MFIGGKNKVIYCILIFYILLYGSWFYPTIKGMLTNVAITFAKYAIKKIIAIVISAIIRIFLDFLFSFLASHLSLTSFVLE